MCKQDKIIKVSEGYGYADGVLLKIQCMESQLSTLRNDQASNLNGSLKSPAPIKSRLYHRNSTAALKIRHSHGYCEGPTSTQSSTFQQRMFTKFSVTCSEQLYE